ncbi:MAG TPA: hypothetical protein VL493_07285 [Candidatus Saccharimonadales bacterium]|jgi:hypothetical protein|nr:hypothetical protein [Candidatus Saccharimonadales bacterium]
MNAASILRSKTVAIASAGFLGAGLLGGVALAAVPATADTAWTTAPNTAPSAQTTDEKARAKLKAVLDALVAKNVITQAQEDAIVSALTADRTAHPKLREFVGDVAKESVSYLGLPAEQVKQQLRAGKSLGDIANATPGKSRDGLLADLDAKAKDRIQAAVAAGTITQAQADQLTPKVLEGIVKVVDHAGSPKPTATN